MVTRALPTDAGCYVDGTWGHYTTARMIEIARTFGYADAADIDLAERKLAAMMPSMAPQLSLDDEEKLSDAADRTEQWFNDNVAPDGYYFGWYEGEFFLQNEEWWQQ